MTKILFIYFMLLLTISLKAQRYLTLEGSIDGKYNIELFITLNDTEGECATAEGFYMYKSVLVPIILKGVNCGEEINISYYEKDKVIENFDLKYDETSGNVTGFWKRGDKALPVLMKDVAIKYNMGRSYKLFGKFVNQSVKYMNLTEEYNWGALVTPIYNDEDPENPTTEAQESRGLYGLYLGIYAPGYLNMNASSSGMGRVSSEDIEFLTIRDAKTPSFLIIRTANGEYTEDMFSENPKSISFSYSKILVYQYKNGVFSAIDNVSAVKLDFEEVKNTIFISNTLQIEFNNSSKMKLLWENGKFVKQ